MDEVAVTATVEINQKKYGKLLHKDAAEYHRDGSGFLAGRLRRLRNRIFPSAS
jgi:hypothetical protein